MAPTFFASTPTSRRNRRRQQKLGKRNHQTESTSGHTSKRTKINLQSWEDTTSTNGYVATVDSGTVGYQFNADCGRPRPQHSNPFSLLDVSIPSPTLSVPPTHPDFVRWDSTNLQHDLNGIEKSPAAILPSFPVCKNPNKQLRGDEWALSLQQNTAIVRSERLANRISAAADLASVKPPRPLSPENNELSTTTILLTAGHEDAFARVPSPLLYHRRSTETSSNPTDPQLSSFTPPSQSIDRYTSRQPMPLSTITASSGQQDDLPLDRTNMTPVFIAAKLPLMGDTLSYNELKGEDAFVNTGTFRKLSNDCTLSAVACKLPILTATNTYIFPKRIYNAYCQPDAAWSGPSYGDTHSSWTSSRKLMFPKLSIPGSRIPSKPSPTLSDTGSDTLRVRHHQVPLAERNRLWLKTSLPAPLPQMFNSRCRSSTQDSFDSKFNVSTATKQAEPAVIESDGMQQPPDCSTCIKKQLDAAPEPVSIDTGKAQPEEDAWNGDVIEWSPDASSVQTGDDQSNLKGDATSFQERNTEVTKLDEILTALESSCPDENTPEQTRDAWLDYHTSHGCVDDDIGSEVHIDIHDVEVNEDNWGWNDKDDWETIASTPVTEVDSQLGLGEDGWAR